MVKKAQGIVLRFSLKPVGPSRSERQLRSDIAEALNEAVQEFENRQSVKVEAQAEPEGGFLGLGIEWIWLLKAFAGGVAAAGGKKVGEELFSYFAESLRKRNLIPGKASTARTATPKVPRDKGKLIRKKTTNTKKR